MLTIYNRQKQAVGAFQTQGYNTEVYEVTRRRRLNSDYSLSFLIPMDSPKYKLLEKEGLIECQGQKYVIKSFQRKREGMGRTVQVTCPHVIRRMMDIRVPYAMAVEEMFGADISALTGILSVATGGAFQFQIMDIFEPKDVYRWGYSNCLKALQDLINLYEAEFIPDNYVIKIYKKITIDNGLQYRYAKNIINNTFETDTNTLVTRMTGLAKDSLTIIGLPASHLTAGEYERLNAVPGAIVDGIIKVPYLISQYANAWATPDNVFFDGEFENNDIEADTEEGKLKLLEEIRKKLAASEIPELQVQVSPADLWKKDLREIKPEIGETAYLVDQEMELSNITARVMELTEYPFDLSKHSQVTLANFILKDENDILAELNASKQTLDSLLTNKGINRSALDLMLRQAIDDINNSKSEVIYDQRGIVLQSRPNPSDQVILTSNGIIITEDGGTTAKTAVTGRGVAAEYIVGILGEFAQIRANKIIVGASGQTIEDSLISSADVWNSKETTSGAQEKANAAQTAAINAAAIDATTKMNEAKAQASAAQTAADSANAKLADIANDNKLTPSEKQATKKEWDIIASEKATIEQQADLYAITTEKTNYQSAYNNLNTYITPLLADLNATSDILGTEFRDNFKAYYDNRTILLKVVADRAKADAQAKANAVNEALRQELRLAAPLPTSIRLDADGITASTTDPTKYARFDYRGLYVKGGAIQIDGGLADEQVSSGGIWNSKTTLINESGIYTGQITTDQLVAGAADISTAMIESLIVGQNVTMGPNATISWGNVTDKNLDYSNITGSKPPTNADNTSGALTAALGSNYTKIGPTYVYTGTLTAEQVNAVAISASSITSGTLTGRTVQTAASGARVVLTSGYGDIYAYNSSNQNIFKVFDQANGNVTVSNPSGILVCGGEWKFTGNVDFTYATHNITAKFK